MSERAARWVDGLSQLARAAGQTEDERNLLSLSLRLAGRAREPLLVQHAALALCRRLTEDGGTSAAGQVLTRVPAELRTDDLRGALARVEIG